MSKSTFVEQSCLRTWNHFESSVNKYINEQHKESCVPHCFFFSVKSIVCFLKFAKRPREPNNFLLGVVKFWKSVGSRAKGGTASWHPISRIRCGHLECCVGRRMQLCWVVMRLGSYNTTNSLLKHFCIILNSGPLDSNAMADSWSR